MKMKRWGMALYVGLMLAVLAAIGGLTATHFGVQEALTFENRNMTARPELTGEALGNGSFFNSLERFFCDRAAGRTTLLRYKTKAELELIHRPVVNGVMVADPEVLLPYQLYELVDRESMAWQAAEAARRLGELQDRVESYGGTFLYVAVPANYSYFEDRYPDYLNSRAEYTRVELELFSAAMAERGVNWLDIGAGWAAQGSPAEYMSQVDHHYTWAGAWDAYQQIMARLNENREEPLYVLGEEDLEVKALPNPFMGSSGRKLCGQWRTGEAFCYPQLKEEIPVTRYDWGNDTPSWAGWITRPQNDWESVAYSYMCGDISETVLRTDRPELPDSLIFGDSFTNALETVWYASFDETRSLDLRMYTEMSLGEYVELYQPQVVVCVRDYEQLLSFTGNGNV